MIYLSVTYPSFNYIFTIYLSTTYLSCICVYVYVYAYIYMHIYVCAHMYQPTSHPFIIYLSTHILVYLSSI